ncbi:MAG: hypothetical protein OEQ29_25305, partial [Alphaproteobacteria bacterium]|nr:hypothetical protein [Alphaproteobacteria bacterium]
LRSTLAAIAGYVVIVIVVMGSIALTWAAVGGAGAFAGEGPAPSAVWMASIVASGFLAAVAGGWVARRIGRSATAVNILIGLILVLGVVSALTARAQYEKRESVDKPVAEMTFMEAGQHARQPAWYNWTIPIIGMVGAWIGGRQRSGD